MEVSRSGSAAGFLKMGGQDALDSLEEIVPVRIGRFRDGQELRHDKNICYAPNREELFRPGCAGGVGGRSVGGHAG